MKNLQLKGSAIVIFGKDFPTGHIIKQKFGTIVANKVFQKNVEALGCKYVELDMFVES